MSEFYSKLEDLLDTEPGAIDGQVALRDLDDWDSLGTLTVVSMISEDYGVTVLSEELADVVTAAQLWELVQSKQERTKEQ